MSRSYRGITAKKHRVYCVDEVLKLYKVSSRNTLSNWVKQGLCPSPEASPQLFRGAELNRFHMQRRAQSKRELRLGEFKCLHCKTAVIPEPASMSFDPAKKAASLCCALCPDCGASVMKLLGETECNALKNYCDPNTSQDILDEGIGAVLGGIDTNAGSESDFQVSLNDRVLFDWQFFAGQYAAATIDAHLAAIREFETFTGDACFSTLTIKSVDAYRQHLSERAGLHHGEDALSRSSVRHRASHVKAFLAWLLNQSSYRRLPRDLPDYLTLSRALNAQTLAPQPKDHPTMEAATEMTLGMPASSLLERRNRAIVAMAFVTGLRAGALSTLRLEHIDCVERTATQDGTLMRAKNGKSYVADWFATTEPLQGIVVAWIEELTQLGFEATDAVFPAIRDLTAQEPRLTSGRPAVPALKSEGAITEAFAAASQVAGTSYTPHSARHTLTALGNRLCTNRVEEKAWSKNLGHANVQTTESNYAKLTEDEKQSVLRTIGQGSTMTSDDKDLCLDYHEHRLSPGTPEFLRAKGLIAERVREREG